MRFSGYGYKEKTVTVQEMSMGAIVIESCSMLVKAGKTDMEIRIVDCFMGTVERYDGVEGVLKHGWTADYRVNVYDVCVMHDNEENTDYLKIIISDDVELL